MAPDTRAPEAADGRFQTIGIVPEDLPPTFSAMSGGFAVFFSVFFCFNFLGNEEFGLVTLKFGQFRDVVGWWGRFPF